MRTSIRKVGNSRGIILPAALIASCGFGTEVELSIDGTRLIIEAARSQRYGWLDGYKPEVDPEVFEALPLDDSDQEWVW